METMTVYLVQTTNGQYVYNGYGTKSIVRSLWVNKKKAEKCANEIYPKGKVIEVELIIKGEAK